MPERQPDVRTAEQFLNLIPDDPGDLLGRCERRQHFLADGSLSHAIGEILDDFEMNVGFQQGDAYLFEGVFDVPLVEASFAAECFEGSLDAFLKVVEHRSSEHPGPEQYSPDRPRSGVNEEARSTGHCSSSTSQ